MRFTVHFILQTAVNQGVVPHMHNPLEAPSLKTLLEELAHNLPHQPSLGVKTLGIRVEPVPESVPFDEGEEWKAILPLVPAAAPAGEKSPVTERKCG